MFAPNDTPVTPSHHTHHTFRSRPTVRSIIIVTVRTWDVSNIFNITVASVESNETMKSVPLCRNNNNNTTTGGTSGGRVQRKRGDLEDEKIQKYLAKLKDLVPLIPKDKRISRLEVIHHVIDYICDLEDMLENHRSVNADAVHSAAAAVMLSSSVQAAVRQPLGIISTPNALAAAVVQTAAAAAVTAQQQQPQSSSSSEPVSGRSSAGTFFRFSPFSDLTSPQRQPPGRTHHHPDTTGNVT